jgi:hypothetical protein
LGYSTCETPETGAKEIFASLRKGALTDGPTTRTVEWYKSLIQWHATLKGVVQRDVVL